MGHFLQEVEVELMMKVKAMGMPGLLRTADAKAVRFRGDLQVPSLGQLDWSSEAAGHS